MNSPIASKPKSAPLPPRLQGKRGRTREQLLDAAQTIVAAKGIQEVSILELANMAGVSNGTFYNYFKTRGEVLDAVALRMAEELATGLRPLLENTSDPATRVALATGRFMSKANLEADFGWALLRLIGTNTQMSALISQYILADLREGKSLGRFHYVSEEAALDLLLGTLLAGIRSLLEGRAGPPHFAHIAEVTLCGLGLDRAEAHELSVLALQP